MEYQVRNWYHFVWLSGDNICEQHVHNLDVGNWVKGDHPVEANGMGSCVQRYKGRDPKKGMGQIFDNHFVEFTYKDGTKMFSQCRHIPNTWNNVSRGDPRHQGRRRAWRPRPQAEVSATRTSRSTSTCWTRSASNEKYNEGWHGATSSFTAVLGRMATYSGQVVRWDEAVAKGPNEFPEKLAWDANPQDLPDERQLPDRRPRHLQALLRVDPADQVLNLRASVRQASGLTPAVDLFYHPGAYRQKRQAH